METSVQHSHEVFPHSSLDDHARQMFAKDFRKYIMYHVTPQVAKVFHQKVKPAFEKKEKHSFSDRDQVRDAMWDEGFIRAAQSLQRISQELIWDSVVPVVEKQANDLNEKAKSLIESNDGKTRLKLDEMLEVPSYLTDVDIHCMPGNYHTEHTTDDTSQGAIFERGAFLYNLGLMGPLNDGVGRLLTEKLQEIYPNLEPKRVLDMGCTSGHQTLPLCDAYPHAEIHALDVAAPVLRYGCARAIALGKDVTFHQKDARDTKFPDGSFDLIVSVIALHETSAASVPQIFEECFRLLAPGGVMAHIDIPDYNQYPDLLFQAIVDADSFHNNEPFWGGLHDIDLAKLSQDVGFEKDSILKTVAPMGSLQWMFFTAQKSSLETTK